MAYPPTHVRLVDGRAECRSGDQRFHVTARESGDGNGFCPTDLIAAAIGS